MKEFCGSLWWVTYYHYRAKFSNRATARTNTTASKVSVFGVFLVRISPHLDWIRRDALYLSVFSPNGGKYGPEKLRIRTLFTQSRLSKFERKIFVYSKRLTSFLTLSCQISVENRCLCLFSTVSWTTFVSNKSIN